MHRGSGRLVALFGMMLALLMGGGQARAQDAGYSTNLPKLAQLQRDYRVADAGETSARQAAACRTLLGVMELFMGPRFARRDFALNEEDRYGEYMACADTHGQAGVSARAAALAGSGVFRDGVIHRYMSAADLERYGKLASLSPAAQAAQTARDDAWYRNHEIEQQTEANAPLRAIGAKVPYAIAALLFSLGGLALLALSLRPPTVNAEGKWMTAAGRRYDLSAKAGVMVAHNKEEEVTFTPGTITYDRGVEVSRTQDTWSVDRQDVFFLIDEKGEERTYRLQNWRVDARPGHRMGVVWATQGKKLGQYLIVWNFNLGSTNQNVDAVRKLFKPSRLGCLLLAIGVFLLVGLKWSIGTCFIAAAIVLVALVIFRSMVGRRRAAWFEGPGLAEVKAKLAEAAAAAEARGVIGPVSQA